MSKYEHKARADKIVYGYIEQTEEYYYEITDSFSRVVFKGRGNRYMIGGELLGHLNRMDAPVEHRKRVAIFREI